MPRAARATMTWAQDSLFTVPQLAKPPSGRCMADKVSKALSTAALTVSLVL